VKAILTKPVVGVQKDTRLAVTVPSRTEVEFSQSLQKDGYIDIECDGHYFLVFCEDLLDACSVDDAIRISFL
jgi:hypothetical protein